MVVSACTLEVVVVSSGTLEVVVVSACTLEVVVVSACTLEVVVVGACTLEVVVVGACTLEVLVVGARTLEVLVVGACTLEVLVVVVTPAYAPTTCQFRYCVNDAAKNCVSYIQGGVEPNPTNPSTHIPSGDQRRWVRYFNLVCLFLGLWVGKLRPNIGSFTKYNHRVS